MTISWAELATALGILSALAGFAMHHIRLSILATVDRRMDARTERIQSLISKALDTFMSAQLLEEKFRHVDTRFDRLERHAANSPKVMDDLQSVLLRLQNYERQVVQLLKRLDPTAGIIAGRHE